MCLLPGAPQIEITPSEKAKQLARYIRVLGFAQLFLAMLLFLSSSWLDGLFCILGATIGHCTVNKETYQVNKVKCYVFLFAYLCFFAVSAACLALGDVGETKTLQPWQLAMRYATLSSSPVVYLISTVIGTMLYNDLRETANAAYAQGGANVNEGQVPPGGGSAARSDNYWRGGGGGGGGHNWGNGHAVGGSSLQPSSMAAPGNVRAPQGPGYVGQSNNETKGFKPFSGKGYRLDE